MKTLFVFALAAVAAAYASVASTSRAVAAPTLPLPPPRSVVAPGFSGERLIRPGTETLITIQTSPKAVCALSPGQRNGQQRPHRLDADDSGVVRVYAKSRAAMSQGLNVVLSCRGASGQTATYPIQIRADWKAPMRAARENQTVAPGTLRPALHGNVATLTNRELLARGYPARPDAVKAPGAYERWLYIVSHAFNAVNRRQVSRSDVSFAPTLPVPPPARPGKGKFNYNSSTWSGAVVSQPEVRFYQIQADWSTPTAAEVPLWLGYAAAAAWVGLDNAGNDLVQSGTDSESWNIALPFGGTITFTNYWAWVESLPYAPSGLPNFPVAPGDQISVDIFLADSNGNTTFTNGDLTPGDDSVWFMIYNMTQGNSYWGTLPRPAAFSGSTAEFVMERPTSSQSGSPYPLANFGIAGAHNCWFADTWFGFKSLDYNGTPPYPFVLDNLTMQNGLDTLASSYTYANFGAPGGGNVLWVWQNYL